MLLKKCILLKWIFRGIQIYNEIYKQRNNM